MSAAANLLNADVGEIAALIERGFRWWTAELAGMMPQRWRRRDGAAVVARIGPDERVRAERGGVALALDPERPVEAAVALESGAVLVRDVAVPRLPPSDLRRAIALDLDRHVPFAPDTIWFDLQLPPAGPARLAVVRRAAAQAALDRAADAGVRPAALGVAAPGGALAFDFLPGIVAAVAPAPWWARARLWWAVAGALAVANVGFAVYRDRADVARLEQLTAAQGDAVAQAARLKARVAAEDRRRAALAQAREQAEPLAMIAALTRALPPPAWAQRLQWDGERVELSGFAPGGADPVAVLRRSAAFRDVRAGATEISAAGLTAPPFELSAYWSGPQ